MNKKKNGYFFGSYNVSLADYSGGDFSQTCFIFPGQGGAFPGMCASEYAVFSQLREKFVLADTLAKKYNLPAISSYVLCPEILSAELLPHVANLALFTIEIAFFEMLFAEGIKPQILTGHSFGEYATMVAAGIFSFEDMFEIIYRRDFFCPLPNTLGYLVALQADVKTTKKIIGSANYHISNINSPTQTIIAIATSEREVVDAYLTQVGVRHKILTTIPQPYHSPFLRTVRTRIKEYCHEADILSLFHSDRMHRPLIPFYSSVLHKVIDADHFSRNDILSIIINQIVEPVDFIRQIRAIEKNGIHRFVEIGAKKVFVKFAEDILYADKKEFKTQIATDLLPQQELSKTDNHAYDEKTFEIVQTTIVKQLGYAPPKITPQSSFQNDLGIDSIKKADIVLTVLDAFHMRPSDTFNASKFERVSDLLLYIEQGASQDAKTVRVRRAVFEPYIFGYKEKALHINEVSLTSIKDSLRVQLTDLVLDTQKSKQLIADFFSTATTPIIFVEADSKEKIDILKIFFFLKSCMAVFSQKAFSLVFISRGNMNDSRIEALNVFFKSLKKELPESFYKHVHGDASFEQGVLHEEAVSSDIEVNYREGKRYVREALRIEYKGGQRVSSRSVIFAIGGGRGITYELLKLILSESKPIVYLAGRSLESDEGVKQNISKLRKLGTHVEYICLDARNKNELEEAYKKIITEQGHLDFVIDAAGMMRVAFLADVSEQNIVEEYESKILPAMHILELAEKYTIKKTIIFSSIVSGYGSAGQTVYAAANAYIGKMTEAAGERLIMRGCFASVIHWPGWYGVGMTADKGILQNLLDKSVSLIKPKRAAELFVSEIVSKSSNAVFYMDVFDDRSFSFTLADIHKHTALIGVMRNPFGLSMTNQEFSRTFDLSHDSFLLDHKITGVPYVPAAYGIVMFLCLGELYTGSMVSLSNIHIYNPIIVEEKPVEALLEMRHVAKKHSFFLRTDRPCFSGVLDETKFSPMQYKIPEAVRTIGAREIYATCGPHDPIFFGSIFQTLHFLSFDSQGNPFTKIDVGALQTISGDKVYDKLILCIDAIFQTLGMSADFGKSAFVPVGVEKLSFFSQLYEKHFVYVLIEHMKLEGDSLTGDAVLVDEVGNALVECKGISMSRVHFKKQS